MKRVVLLGPCFKTVSELKAQLKTIAFKKTDYIIGVDRGVEWGIKARLALGLGVGDWDSLHTKRSLAGLKILTLPVDKDRSDLYYAAQAALNAGAQEIVVLGMGGGRLDHLLAGLLDLEEISDFVPVRVLNRDELILLLSSQHKKWKWDWESRFLKKQATFSVFSLQGDAQGVNVKGSEFPLKKAHLKASSHGLSNRVKSPLQMCIEVQQGHILIVIPF